MAVVVGIDTLRGCRFTAARLNRTIFPNVNLFFARGVEGHFHCELAGDDRGSPGRGPTRVDVGKRVGRQSPRTRRVGVI
jgi:hypothetical protein